MQFNMVQLGKMGGSSLHSRGCVHLFLLIIVSSAEPRAYGYILTILRCLSARRRRRAGRQPFYGTGWARTPFGHGQAQYNPGYQTQQQPNYNQTQAPPNYNQNAGGYYGQNQGYFGGRQTEVEMQPPSNTYRGGEDVYQAPPGPPPAKK
jgi:hypothetical protein